MKIARVVLVVAVFVYAAFEFSKYLHKLGMAG
jgi:hypothetical protein